MACVAKCDKCGEYFDWRSDDAGGFAFLSHNHKCGYNIKGEKYDICPECVHSLRDWLEVEKKGWVATIAKQYMGGVNHD